MTGVSHTIVDGIQVFDLRSLYFERNILRIRLYDVMLILGTLIPMRVFISTGALLANQITAFFSS